MDNGVEEEKKAGEAVELVLSVCWVEQFNTVYGDRRL